MHGTTIEKIKIKKRIHCVNTTLVSTSDDEFLG
jgi:hypothetical protein